MRVTKKPKTIFHECDYYGGFMKHVFEGGSYELTNMQNEIAGILRELQKWMEPETVSRNMLVPFDKAFIHKEPYGVALIIGAWNYPFLLTLKPLLGAISGGNCAVVKPSENSPQTAAKIAELIPRYLDTVL